MGQRTVVPPQSVNRATTTLAQRQAAPSPFRSATKPAQPKINPLQQATSPQPRPDLPPGAQMRKPMLGAQPTTPFDVSKVDPGMNPIANLRNQLPGAGGPAPTMPSMPMPQPFNPQPNPGQLTLDPSMNPYGPQPDPVFGGGFGGGKSMGSQPANFNNGYQVGGDINIDPATGQPTPYQPDSMPMDYGNQPNSYNGQLDLSGMYGQPGGQQPPQNMAQMGSSSYGGGKSVR